MAPNSRSSGRSGTATLPTTAARAAEEPIEEPAATEPKEARTAQQRAPLPPRVYGYTFAGNGVWFEYGINSETNLVTDDRTGTRSRLDPKTEVEVAVAGDFTGWDPIPMKRHPRVGNRFGVHVPLSQFPGDYHQFKFLLNERLWAEPPAFASNTAPANIGDPSARNLVIVLDREVESEIE